MYSAKKVLPVPLSPYRMTGVAAGANACARDTASTITGAKAMGTCDDGCERRSETRRGVVTQFETLRVAGRITTAYPQALVGETPQTSQGIFPNCCRRAATKRGRWGKRAPVLGEARQARLRAPRSKEIADQLRTFLRLNSAFDFNAMIQPRMPHQIRHRPAHPRLLVVRPKHQLPDLCQHNRPRALRA